MKKVKNKKDKKCCVDANKVFEQISKKVKTGAKDVQKYAKKNPKETKMVAAGIGAFLLAILAFLVGKRKK